MQSSTTRIWLLAIIILISLTSFAGSIKGRVTDGQTGEPLSGATIQIQQNGVKRYTTVNLDGSYIFRNVAAGKYELSIESVGYTAVTSKTVLIKADNDVVV